MDNLAVQAPKDRTQEVAMAWKTLKDRGMEPELLVTQAASPGQGHDDILALIEGTKKLSEVDVLRTKAFAKKAELAESGEGFTVEKVYTRDTDKGREWALDIELQDGSRKMLTFAMSNYRDLQVLSIHVGITVNPNETKPLFRVKNVTLKGGQKYHALERV